MVHQTYKIGQKKKTKTKTMEIVSSRGFYQNFEMMKCIVYQ
jgi:hypothetical protein